MKKILAWPAPLLQKWLLSLLLCLPFLAAAIVSAFSGDRTFLILSALLLAFLRRSLRRALCNARERTLLCGGRHLSFGFRHSVSAAAQGRAAKSRRRTACLLHRKEQAAVCGASLSGLFASFLQFQVKSRPHTCRSHVHWQSRKLNPCLSIVWNQQTEPLGFLKLLSTCFR